MIWKKKKKKKKKNIQVGGIPFSSQVLLVSDISNPFD